MSASKAQTPDGIIEGLNTGQYNLFSVPGVVDVSGMEFSIGQRSTSLSATPGIAASTDVASSPTFTFSDGGPTGDATGAAVLFTAVTSTTAWVARVPKDIAGTSTTDLDADDWVNFRVTIQPGTSDAEAAQVDLAIAYIYGKPGSIN